MRHWAVLLVLLAGCTGPGAVEAEHHAHAFVYIVENQGDQTLAWEATFKSPDGTVLWADEGTLKPGAKVAQTIATAEQGVYLLTHEVRADSGRVFGSPQFDTRCDEERMMLHLVVAGHGSLLGSGGIRGSADSACAA